MLVALGFLGATLLALAALPSLARRADRLARRRAEQSFPLSLAEIAADRDHLRAELALRGRALEQRAESGFAARAGAMQEIGRRDMALAKAERDIAERDARIAALETALAETTADRDQTRDRLAAETAGHAATSEALGQRIADLAALERRLAETRTALTGTSGDLDARSRELADERATLGRIEALLASREEELGRLRGENDGLRVAQVESRTRILVLEGKRDELAEQLSQKARALETALAAAQAMTTDRDSERLRADALGARAAQAEAGVAAANARNAGLTAGIARLEDEAREQTAARAELERAREALAGELARAHREAEGARVAARAEAQALHDGARAQAADVETAHAQIQTLTGALAQARAELTRLKRELTQARKAAPETAEGDAALRREISRVAESLLALAPKREAAE